MASQATSVRFDKLTEHNHSSWKFQIKAYLGTKRLRDFLTRTPPISDGEEILANADQALCELQMSVSNSMIHVIRDCVTAKDAFEAIQAYFDSKTSASAAALSQEMSNLEMRPRESITTYFARAERCRDLLTEVGYPMNHKSFQMQLLNGLSKEYESVRTTYLVSPDPNYDNPTTGLMLLRTRLQGVEVSLQSTSSKPAPKALQADAKTCSHCGHPGHVVRECRTLARERAAARKKKQDQDGGKDGGNKTRPKCNWCGQPGHIEARCFAKRDGAAKTAGAGKGSQDGDGDAGKRAPVAFMATPLRYEEFVDAPKRYDPSDFALLDQVRLPLFDSVGTPDIEYFTDQRGDNAFLQERCYKDGRSYFDDDYVSGRFGYANPPFREAMRALQHYFTCKARDPTNTRSVWILPYDPSAKWFPLTAGMKPLAKWSSGTMLFTLPDLKAPGLRRVLKPTPFPVMALYDPPVGSDAPSAFPSKVLPPIAALVAPDPYQAQLLLDSGASNHMTGDLRLLHDYKPYGHATRVKGISDSPLYAHGTGTVKIQHRASKGWVETEFRHVIYVEDMPYTLISLSTITNHGGRFTGIDDILDVYRDELHVIRANKLGNLYLIDQDATAIRLPEHEHSAFRAAPSAARADVASAPGTVPAHVQALLAKPDAATWHRRLGHMPYLTILKLKALSTGIDVPESELRACDKDPAVCRDCLAGRHRRDSRTSSTPKITEPCRRLHVDLMGKMGEVSTGDAEYILTIVDEGTRYVTVQPIKTKDMAEAVLSVIIARWERITKHKVVFVRSDRGGEFTCGPLQKFFDDRGITPSSPCRTAPSQTGWRSA
jgi:hypothetical protein